MLLLSKKSFASKARYGYVRGIEPVSYVRDIQHRYRAYVEIAGHRLSQTSSAEGRSTAQDRECCGTFALAQ